MSSFCGANLVQFDEVWLENASRNLQLIGKKRAVRFRSRDRDWEERDNEGGKRDRDENRERIRREKREISTPAKSDLGRKIVGRRRRKRGRGEGGGIEWYEESRRRGRKRSNVNCSENLIKY